MTEWAVGRLFRRLLIRRFAVRWEWPEAEDRSLWTPLEVSVGGQTVVALRGPATGASPDAPSKSVGVVVCAPPITRAAKGYFLSGGHARALRAAGYDVVVFDFNGFGESPYRSINYAADLLAVASAAREASPDLPVHLLGVCFGATVGLTATAQTGHTFASAVFESPYPSVERVFRSVGRSASRGWAYRCAAIAVRAIAPAFWRYSPLRSAGRVSGLREALFLACENDETVPPSEVVELSKHFATAPAPASGEFDVWVVEGADHLRGFYTAPTEYLHRAVRCFRAASSPAPTASG